jgi:NAD(P)H-flavin reductase
LIPETLLLFTGTALLKANTNLIGKCKLASADVLSELTNETRDERVGVFVCGPESMVVSVASFCKNQNKIGCKDGSSCTVDFHSVNFSL